MGKRVSGNESEIYQVCLSVDSDVSYGDRGFAGSFSGRESARDSSLEVFEVLEVGHRKKEVDVDIISFISGMCPTRTRVEDGGSARFRRLCPRDKGSIRQARG